MKNIQLPDEMPGMTLAEAREELRQLMSGSKGEPVGCRLCGRSARVTRRTTHKDMVRCLHHLAGNDAPQNLSQIARGGDYAKLALPEWGLIRPAGGATWEITEDGRAWLEGQISVPRWVFTFAEVSIGLPDVNSELWVHDARLQGIDLGSVMSVEEEVVDDG